MEKNRAHASRIRLRVDLCRARAVRPCDEIELRVAEHSADVVEIARGMVVRVLREVRARGELLGALCHGSDREHVAQAGGSIARVVERAAQGVGLSGAALIDQQQVAVAQQRAEQADEVFRVADRVLAGAAHQRNDRIGVRLGRFVLDHSDRQRQAAACGFVGILRHLHHAALRGAFHARQLACGEEASACRHARRVKDDRQHHPRVLHHDTSRLQSCRDRCTGPAATSKRGKLARSLSIANRDPSRS